MKVSLDRTSLQIDIVDLFSNMDDAAKQKIIEMLAWQSPIWEEITRGVCEEYAADSYNSGIHELRLAFLQSEDVSDNTRAVIRSLLDTIKHLQGRISVRAQIANEWRQWYSKAHPDECNPVPFYYYDLEWTDNETVHEFMERNGLLP